MVDLDSLNPKDKTSQSTLIAIVLIILFALLLLIFVGRPLWAKQQATSKQLNSQKDYLSKLDNKLQVLTNLESQKSQLEEKNNKILAAIPTYNEVGSLFTEFEKIAQENGITIKRAYQDKSLTFVAEPSANDLISTVTYTSSGEVKNYGQIKTALQKLQESLRMVKITQVNVTANEKNLKSDITVKAFVRQ